METPSTAPKRDVDLGTRSVTDTCIGTAVARLTFSEPSLPQEESSHVSLLKATSPSRSRGRQIRRSHNHSKEQDASRLSEADAVRQNAQVHIESKDTDCDSKSSRSTRSRRSSRFSSNHNSSTSPEPSQIPHHLLGLSSEAAPERKPFFEEEDSELIVGPDNVVLVGVRMLTSHEKNLPYYSSNLPEEIDTSIAVAPIKGEGLPLDASDQTQRHPEPSEITDRGDQIYAKLESQGRISSFPLSHDSSIEVVKGLGDRIFASAKAAYQSRTKFIPNGQITSLINEDTVFRELTRLLSDTHTPENIRRYAKVVSYFPPPPTQKDQKPKKIITFRKLFTILVMIERQSAIGKFLREEVSDADLPLRAFEREDEPGTYDLRRKSTPNKNLECFRGWSQSRIWAFENRQWMTLAPFFTRGEQKNVHHYILEDAIILPFTVDNWRRSSSQRREEFGGGFGRVFKAHIHPDHHNFNDHKVFSSSFAIKKLYSTNKDDFDREVEMLKKFSGDSHPHLVSLLATYVYFDEFYLIFHWAEADLLRYWKQINPSPAFDSSTVLWMGEQCEGIADGLSKIHRYESNSWRHTDSDLANARRNSAKSQSNHGTTTKFPLYGRHGDIKPENVLWFPREADPSDKGTLQISDFGVAELNSRNSRSHKAGSQVAISPTYRPPECDLPCWEISRSYDIWTLGCLYLEFITWLLGGRTLLLDFAKRRKGHVEWGPDLQEDTFFEVVKCEETKTHGAMVKLEVLRFIEELHSHSLCTEFLHEFLNMIQLDMLVVESSNPNTKKRISCGVVRQKLKHMVSSCQSSQTYATTPSPWAPGRRNRDEDIEAVEANLSEEQAKALSEKNFRVHFGPTRRMSTD